jgi:hypothetical protein
VPDADVCGSAAPDPTAAGFNDAERADSRAATPARPGSARLAAALACDTLGACTRAGSIRTGAARRKS